MQIKEWAVLRSALAASCSSLEIVGAISVIFACWLSAVGTGSGGYIASWREGKEFHGLGELGEWEEGWTYYHGEMDKRVIGSHTDL